jgi:hypothetical protein
MNQELCLDCQMEYWKNAETALSRMCCERKCDLL